MRSSNSGHLLIHIIIFLTSFTEQVQQRQLGKRHELEAANGRTEVAQQQIHEARDIWRTRDNFVVEAAAATVAIS